MRYDFKRRVIKNKGWRINEEGTPILDKTEYFKGGYRGYGEDIEEARYWVSKKEDLPVEEFKTDEEWDAVIAEEKKKAEEAEKKAKAEEKKAKAEAKKAKAEAKKAKEAAEKPAEEVEVVEAV